jgi:Flp pilus assembly secretin CpaC
MTPRGHAQPRVSHPVVAILLVAASLAAGEALPADRIEQRQAGDQARVAALGPVLDDARFLLAAGQARVAAGRLRAALAEVPGDAPRRDEATALLAQAESAQATDDLSNDEAARRSSATMAAQAAAREAEVVGSQRDIRLARIRDLRQREHHELALAHCRVLLRDLPADTEIEQEFRDLLSLAHAARRTSIAERERELRAEIALLVERSLIPEGFDGEPVWPADWDERRRSRRSILDGGSETLTTADAVRDRLAQRVSIVLEATPAVDALAQLARLSGVNIVVAPELQAASDRIVTLRAARMRLEDVLTWITEQGGTRWSITKGAVFVGDQAVSERVVALHDVAGLMIGTVDQPGPVMDMNTPGGGGGGASLIAAEAPAEAAATADDIAELIRRTVSPRAWEEDGNGIVIRGTTLLVTAPDEVQRLIREFIRAQEAQRSLAVRIDARWLELTDRYVEEIGVEWISGAGQMVAPATGQPSAGFLRRTGAWSVAANSTNQLPATAMSLSPATSGSGLTLQTAFFGENKFNAVLHAIERNAQGRVLQAPEITCLNGQQAHAVFASQLAYISDYEVVSGFLDPVIQVLNLGTMIEVRPMVSSDRRYVTLDLRSSVTSATLFTEYLGAVVVLPGVLLNGLTPLPGVDPPVIEFTGAYPIELPNVAVQSTSTTVMVPDRGSLLVGGFTRSLDQFSSTRVPLLGSIPFLGRLFGARGRYADRTKLYLMSTVSIINYPELEARL